MALVGCDHTAPPAVAPPDSVIEVVVSPAAVGADYQDTIHFRVHGLTVAGDSVAVTVEWAATGGTISADGVFSADTTPGDYLVGAANAQRVADIARVVVGFSGTVTESLTTSIRPGQVTDLGAAGIGDSGMTLRFTEVDDGTGEPAQYHVRVGVPSLPWSAATIPARGTCAPPLVGRAVGATHECTVLGLAPETRYEFRLVAFNGTWHEDALFGNLSNAHAVTTLPTPDPPGRVESLAVAGTTDSSATLSFTQVSDGTGQPAHYNVRYAVPPISWGSARAVERGTCASPLEGRGIGETMSCTALGLAQGTEYAFQLVAFRGTLGSDAVFGPLSNVVTGTTSGAPPPVASVAVTPETASVPAGGYQQFSATLRDASGNALTGRAVSWTSNAPTVASVNASGLAAALTAGVATVTASSEGQRDSAALTVTDAPQETLFQETFEDTAFSSRRWYDNPGMGTTTAEHIPGSTRALEARFPAGATTPTWGGAARRLFSPTPTLYVSYWVKYSANWVGSAKPYHPHELLVMSDQDGDYEGLSNGWLVAYIEHNYQPDGGRPRLVLQDNRVINTSLGIPPINLVGITEDRSVSGCNGVVELNVVTDCYNAPPWYNAKELRASEVAFQPNPGPDYKGAWNHVEAYFQMNSVVAGIGIPNGVMQYWINGKPVIDRHDILFRTGARPSIRFRQFVIAPYIGDGSPVDQVMWLDDLVVATAKP